MDFDLEIWLMEAEEEFSEIMQQKAMEWKAPDWFYIGLGTMQAPTERHRMHAKQLYLDFLKFSAPNSVKTFRELIEAFTSAKQRNLI